MEIARNWTKVDFCCPVNRQKRATYTQLQSTCKSNSDTWNNHEENEGSGVALSCSQDSWKYNKYKARALIVLVNTGLIFWFPLCCLVLSGAISVRPLPLSVHSLSLSQSVLWLC